MVIRPSPAQESDYDTERIPGLINSIGNVNIAKYGRERDWHDKWLLTLTDWLTYWLNEITLTKPGKVAVSGACMVIEHDSVIDTDGESSSCCQVTSPTVCDKVTILNSLHSRQVSNTWCHAWTASRYLSHAVSAYWLWHCSNKRRLAQQCQEFCIACSVSWNIHGQKTVSYCTDF